MARKPDPYEPTPYVPFGAYSPTPEEADWWHRAFFVIGVITGIVGTLWVTR